MACACKSIEKTNRFADKKYGNQLDNSIYYGKLLIRAIWNIFVKLFVCLCIVIITIPIMVLIIISYLFKGEIKFKMADKVVKLIDENE